MEDPSLTHVPGCIDSNDSESPGLSHLRIAKPDLPKSSIVRCDTSRFAAGIRSQLGAQFSGSVD